MFITQKSANYVVYCGMFPDVKYWGFETNKTIFKHIVFYHFRPYTQTDPLCPLAVFELNSKSRRHPVNYKITDTCTVCIQL